MAVASFLLCWCCFILPVSTSTSCLLPAESIEQRLHDHLFKNYNPLVRPSNASSPVIVSIEMVITSIVDVKDMEGVITIAGWVDMKWKDMFLSWDAADYGNISSIVVPAEHVWLPDVTLHSALESYFFDAKNVPVLIRSDGTVDFAPGGVSSHSCDWDTTLFPFDTQECTFGLDTWLSGPNLIFLKNMTLGYHGEWNEVWDVIERESEADNTSLAGVQHTFRIKRKPLYYVTYIFLPLFMMAIVNLLVFWLPVASSEKLSLAITVLLAFYVLLITINEQLPISSTSTHLLTIYMSCLMSICLLSMVVTVLVVHLYHNANAPVPPWVIKLLRLGETNRENNSATACEQERSLRASPPAALSSWKDVSVAVDRLSFFIFFTFECIITLAAIICYAVGIHNAMLDSE